MPRPLLNFGGHTYAAGLTLKWDKVREFRDRFQQYVEEHISPQQTEPMLNIDAEIDFKDITKHLQTDLKRFSPFDYVIQKPIFCTNHVYDYGTSKVVGREQEHIKLELVDSKSSNVVNGIAFGQSASARYIKSKRSFDIAYTIEENVFKKNQVQLQIEDIRPNNRMRKLNRNRTHTRISDSQTLHPMTDTFQEILRTYWGIFLTSVAYREISSKAYHTVRIPLVLMPTGGGKSITFQVPALAQEGVCIVITPLIAHMKDQVSHLKERGTQAAAIYPINREAK